MRDERIGGVHDHLRGAVVALQAEDLALGIILLEIEDVLDARTAESVDGLAVVAHHADVAAELRQLLEDQVLRHVGVLVLVHHDVRETAGDRLERLLVVPQQVVHIQQDVVEIHHPALLELLLVARIHLAQARPLGVAVLRLQLRIALVGRDRDEVVLGHRDAGQHVARLVDLVVQAHLLHAGLDGALRVGRIIDGEVLRIPQELRVFAQETHEHRMESAHHDPADILVPHHLRDTLLHLACRLLRKSQGKYAGIRLLRQNICHSARQYAGFAGAGARHNQHRSFNTFDGSSLLVVQILQNRCHFIHHCGTKLQKKVVSSRRDLRNLITLYSCH